MRHLIVTRVTLALVALFLLCAGLFAWLRTRVNETPVPARSSIAATGTPAVPAAAAPESGVPETGPPGNGAALFARHCANCHTADALRSRLGTGPDRSTRLRELETFLRDHGDATPDADRSILDYLATTAQR